jgi:hypothetical protein
MTATWCECGVHNARVGGISQYALRASHCSTALTDDLFALPSANRKAPFDMKSGSSTPQHQHCMQTMAKQQRTLAMDAAIMVLVAFLAADGSRPPSSTTHA